MTQAEVGTSKAPKRLDLTSLKATAAAATARTAHAMTPGLVLAANRQAEVAAANARWI